MEIKQKVQDFILLVKQERKYQVMLALVVVFLAWGFLSSHERSVRRPTRFTLPQQPVDKDATGAGKWEAFDDLVVRFDKEIKNQRKGLEEALVKIDETNAAVLDTQTRTAEILKKVIGRLTDLERRPMHTVSAAGADGTAASAEDGGWDEIAQEPDLPAEALEPWGESLDEQEVMPPPEPEKKQRIAVVGVGDSVRVKLLAGVNAPTDGTPYPTLFKLFGEVQGPDGSSLPLGEARLMTAAQGSLSDSRVLFRLTSLSVRFPDGSRGVYPVDGWIVGEDGIRGMEGILIDPIGKALAGNFMSGAVEGYGEGVSRSQQTQVITEGGMYDVLTGSTNQYALAKGMQKAGQRWGRFIDERSRMLVPHVKVLSGREATAIFSKNLMIEDLYDQLEEDEEVVYASLD